MIKTYETDSHWRSPAWLKQVVWAVAAILFSTGAQSGDSFVVMRQDILDTIRPVASQKAGQTVRIKLDRLNIDRGWAVVVGNLVATPGNSMDWELAGCHPDLDHMLWVVLEKTDAAWKIKELELCIAEPPWWKDYAHFDWPCGVYAGLENGGEGALDVQCRKSKRRKRHEPHVN